MKSYYKITVDNVSLETYEDDGELFGDDGFAMEEAYSKNQVEFIKKRLTNRQRAVLELIVAGYKRKEIAEELGIVLQAVHQIIPRIRKRVSAMPSVTKTQGNRLHDFA